MRRSRSKHQQYQMTLFPFLAVLVCTMGVLIILLVLVTKMADDQAAGARKEVAEKTDQKIDRLQLDLDTEDIRIEGIRELRPDLQTKLDQFQTLRSHVENETREIQQKIQLARSEWQSLKDVAANPLESGGDMVQAETEFGRMQTEILQNRTRLEQLKKQVAGQATVYSIVPHDGAAGTNRRPIYVECTQQGLILQPHGIILRTVDFARPVMPGNPFDAALLAVRDYWLKLGLVDQNTQPYPLMVIRPDGALAYGLARQAMRNWEDQFGYELIEQHKKLDFGKKDPELTRRLESVIAESKKFQRQLIASANHQAGRFAGGGRPRSGMRASPTGGFVATGENGMSGTRGMRGKRSAPSLQKKMAAANRGGSKLSGDRNQRPSKPSDPSNPASQRNSAESNSGGKQGSATQPLAAQRGKNWALPTRTEGGTAYKRPIRIVCSKSEIAIRPAASHQMIRIPVLNNHAKTVDQLVHQVWTIIDSWDIAAAGGYWKPELVVEIGKDGKQNYHSIAKLLEGSGLEVTRSTR